MAVSKTSSITGYFEAILEDALFVAREQNIMTNLVTNYSARGWMARKLSTYPALSASSIQEGVDFSSATEFTKTAVATLTPGMVIVQVILTDERIETDPDDARADAATEMGNAIATKIDADIAGDFASFSKEVGTNTAGSAGAAALAQFAKGMAYLRAQKAPNPLYIVIHPYHWLDIWNELGQPASNKSLLGDVANEALRSFFVGDWLNATWFVNANIPTSGSKAVSAIFNPQALAFDSRRPPTLEPERDASLRAWELNMTAGYAHGVRRAAFGVKVTNDATEPA